MRVLYTLLGLAVLLGPITIWHLLARLLYYVVDRTWRFDDGEEAFLAHVVVLVGVALAVGLLIAANKIGYRVAEHWQ